MILKRIGQLEVLGVRFSGKKIRILLRRQFRRSRRIRRVDSQELFLNRLMMKVSLISSKLLK